MLASIRILYDAPGLVAGLCIFLHPASTSSHSSLRVMLETNSSHRRARLPDLLHAGILIPAPRRSTLDLARV